MKLPTRDRAIKQLLLLLPSFIGVACGPIVAEAPFSARPGTVERGDLRGPFDGQVLDADSGKPIAGATVLASWSGESGAGITGPASSFYRMVETDTDGRYHIPPVKLRGNGRLMGATLIVYRRGYTAYRSDRRYPSFERRVDFIQAGNVVRLTRFPEDGSHMRHLRFVGVGGPLATLTAWERQLASEEAARDSNARGPAEPGGSPEAPLDASGLLSPDELKAVTGFDGRFELGKLGDRETSPSYDSIHFRAVDRSEQFDAAIRVFRAEDPDGAEDQYESIRRDYPSTEDKDEVGDRSLRAREDDILGIVALDRSRTLVLVFTCGVSQCRDHDTVASLMRRMWSRLDRVTKRRGATGPAGSGRGGRP